MTPAAWRGIARRVVPGVRLARGASGRALVLAEAALEVSLPKALRDLLSASNGLVAADGTWPVWPVAKLVSQNRAFRDPAQFEADLYAPFDRLLLFGGEGNGDLFGFDVALEPPTQGIVKWDHETDARTTFAQDLEHYLGLRGGSAAAGVEGVGLSSQKLPAQVVSVWISSHRSRTAFDAYLAAGGSGKVSKDGLPLSRFQADYGLSLQDALGSEQHAFFASRPTSIRQLLDGVYGGEGLVANVVRRAAATGRAKVQAAILVYGLRYKQRADAEPRNARFLGWFRFD